MNENTLSDYDKGWNSRVREELYNPKESRDWREGWKDCNEVDPEDRELID